MKKFVKNLLALTLISISSQAVAAEQMSAPAKIIDQERSDPFEALNRKSWSLNYDIFDEYLLRPTALFYRNNIPRPLKKSM